MVSFICVLYDGTPTLVSALLDSSTIVHRFIVVFVDDEGFFVRLPVSSFLPFVIPGVVVASVAKVTHQVRQNIQKNNIIYTAKINSKTKISMSVLNRETKTHTGQQWIHSSK